MNRFSLPQVPRPPLARRREGLRRLAAGLLSLSCLPALQAAKPADAASGSELERALTQLLRDKPELVREALNTLEQREAAARQRDDQARLAGAARAIYSQTGATVLGNPAGDVTLVEFFDYRCAYCRHLQADINKLIQSDRQLRVLIKHLPILGPESETAAHLVLAAGQGPAAQQLHQRLVSARELDAASLQAFKQPTTDKGMDKAHIERGLSDVRQLAQRLDIQGTPALLVGEHLLRGASGIEPLKVALQATRARQGRRPPAGA